MSRQHIIQTKKQIAPPKTKTEAQARSPQHPMEEMQALYGNRAVNQLLASQPSLQAKPMFGGLSGELQNTPMLGKGGQTPTVLQAKLAIGAVGDKYEQEAYHGVALQRKINDQENDKWDHGKNYWYEDNFFENHLICSRQWPNDAWRKAIDRLQQFSSQQNPLIKHSTVITFKGFESPESIEPANLGQQQSGEFKQIVNLPDSSAVEAYFDLSKYNSKSGWEIKEKPQYVRRVSIKGNVRGNNCYIKHLEGED